MIGVNDSMWPGYCQCDGCKALTCPAGNRCTAAPDYSNRFFTFANRVAEHVAAKYPNRYLGCLAYNACENPPSLKVHPMIVPYLTNDRAQWRDAKFAQVDRDWIAAWRAVCPSVAVYNYDYGAGYVIPRVFTSLQGQYFGYCHAQGVKGWYAENLLHWDWTARRPGCAANCYGTRIRKWTTCWPTSMATFSARPRCPCGGTSSFAEAWLEQPGKAVWFGYFYDPRQLDLFPAEVCAQARALLDQAGTLATAEPYRRRVDLCSKAFHMTELYSTVYHANRPLGTLATSEQIEAAAARLLRGIGAEHERQKFLADVVDKEPLLKPVARFESQANSTAWGPRWGNSGGSSSPHAPPIGRTSPHDWLPTCNASIPILRQPLPPKSCGRSRRTTRRTCSQTALLSGPMRHGATPRARIGNRPTPRPAGRPGDATPLRASCCGLRKAARNTSPSRQSPAPVSFRRCRSSRVRLTSCWPTIVGRSVRSRRRHWCWRGKTPKKPGSTSELLDGLDRRGLGDLEHGGGGRPRPKTAATAVVMLSADAQGATDVLDFDNVHLFELPNKALQKTP